MKILTYKKDLPISIAICTGVVLFLVLSPIEFNVPFFIPLEINQIIAAGWMTLLLSGIIFSKLVFGGYRFNFRITPIDTLLGFYIIYIILHLLIFIPVNPDPLFLVENATLLLFYIIFRHTCKKWKLLLIAFIPLAAIHQLLYGIAKQTGWFAPGYGLSDIQGNYTNQGPFAGFIACAFIITVSVVFSFLHNRKRDKSVFKLPGICTLGFIVLVLFTVLLETQSRAAWIGSLGAFSWLLLLYFNRQIKSFFKTSFHKGISFVILLFCTIILINLLYRYKKESADGRLLVWQVTLRMIAENPVLGHGINQFPANYMHYQAEWFKENADDSHKNLADNTLYAFNEVLRIISEQGIAGLVIILLVIIAIFTTKTEEKTTTKNSTVIVARAGLISLLIFGLFSYPGDIFQLKLCALLFTAIIAGEQKEVMAFSANGYKLIGFALLVTTPILTQKLYKTERAFRKWNRAFTGTSINNFRNCTQICNELYPVLKHNGAFLTSYGKVLYMAENHEQAIEILHLAAKKLPTTLVYETLGRCYQALGMYDDAEKMWHYASLMVPARFTPGYLTAKMYEKTGKTKEAVKLARKLLQKRVKVNSVEVYRMREELKQMIDSTILERSDAEKDKLNKNQFLPNL